MSCRRKAVITTLILAVLEFPVVAAGAYEGTPQGAKVFRAGAFAIDITPTKLPVIVSGSSVEQGARQVVDPLHARCLVLDDGETQIAIVVVDILLIPCPMMDEIKRAESAGLTRDNSIRTLRIEGPNRPGLGAKIAGALAEAGINIASYTAAALGNLHVTNIGFDHPEDVEKARTIVVKALSPVDT